MRRYGVPADMIELATARRLAGDWRGACEAANVAVEVDPAAIARDHGDAVAGQVADDLRHLVPDLLRWHLPEQVETLVRTGQAYPLSLHPGGAALFAQLPDRTDQPQRLRLRFGPVTAADTERGFHLSRERWDDRCTGELLARCGGGSRLPFFTAAGVRLPAGEVGGDGPEGLTERVHRLLRERRVEEAWDAAGFDLGHQWRLVEYYRPGLTVLAGNARLLAADAGTDTAAATCGAEHVLLLDRLDTPRPRVRIYPVRSQPPGVPLLPRPAQYWPPVLAELLQGRLDPGQLHPLVGAALFPGRPTPTMPAAPQPSVPVRIECGGQLHQVRMRDGVLTVPHTPAELVREQAMHALGGGPPPACVAVHLGWRSPGGWLPLPLERHRDLLLRLVMHGESAPVGTLLDAGTDPHAADSRGRTLLHLLPWLFPAEARLRILDRLLAAGLAVDAADGYGCTPLHYAVARGGSVSLIRALLAAGADPAAVDDAGRIPRDLVPAARRGAVTRLLTGPAGDGGGA